MLILKILTVYRTIKQGSANFHRIKTRVYSHTTVKLWWTLVTKIVKKYTNFQREKVTIEIRKYFKLNGNENTEYRNFYNATKARATQRQAQKFK